MKTFLTILLLYCIYYTKANTCDTLPFQAKPPMKISKIDDRAVSIKITRNTAKKPQPVYIVDGILKQAEELTAIDPATIEQIEILKTPTNWIRCKPIAGIIVITTKTGNAKKLKVQDENGAGVSGASVSIIDKNNPADTIKLIANEAGEIISSKLLNRHSYHVTVSSVGYQTEKETISFDNNNKKTISLTKYFLEQSPVIITSYQSTRRCDMGCRLPGLKSQSISEQKGYANCSLKIYPNPANQGSAINIELPKEFSGDTKIQLYDFSGHLVLQQQLSAKADIQRMRLPAIAAGAYQVILFNDQSEKSVAGKLVVL